MYNENKDPNDHHDDEKMVVIHIDHKQYKTTKGIKSPAEIRAIAEPPISEEYDLWIEVPGPGDDHKVEQSIEVTNGMHFYSVLRQINPGSNHGTT